MIFQGKWSIITEIIIDKFLGWALIILWRFRCKKKNKNTLQWRPFKIIVKIQYWNFISNVNSVPKIQELITDDERER
jgi:hypothetical protein